MSHTPEHATKIADEFIHLEPATLLQSKRSGGPKTDEGKTRSSENSTKHGMCSNRLILPGEDPEEYAQIKEGWMSDYNPGIFSSHALVTNVATSHWLMLRTQRRCDHFELSLCEKSPIDWTDQDHRNLNNFMRYRTAAERTFHRNFAALEKHRSTRMREFHTEERLRLKREELVFKIEALALKREVTSAALPTEPAAPKQTAPDVSERSADSQRNNNLEYKSHTGGIPPDHESLEFTREYFRTHDYGSIQQLRTGD